MTFEFNRKTDNVDDVMAEDINELQAAIETLSQLSGGINLQGDHDASTEVYPADPVAGDLYIISVAGTIDGTSYAVGDLIVYDGDEWIKIPLSLDISGTLTYKGVWDASTEAYPEDPDVGDYYIINVAGTIETVAYVVGDIITYDTDENWGKTELGVGVAENITDLGDVDTTGVSDGDALVYDSGESKWVPGTTVEYPEGWTGSLSEGQTYDSAHARVAPSTLVINSANFYGGLSAVFTPGNAGYVLIKVPLMAGTYSIRVNYGKGANSGKYDLYMDNVKISASELDMYAAAVAYNNEWSINSITVTGDGIHTLKFLCTGKNASSGSYNIFGGFITLTRTA